MKLPVGAGSQLDSCPAGAAACLYPVLTGVHGSLPKVRWSWWAFFLEIS